MLERWLGRIFTSAAIPRSLENIYIVTDFSTNGTFADGERLEKGVPTPLMSGAELTFARGETKIKLG